MFAQKLIFSFFVLSQFFYIFAKLYVRANPSQNSVWECGSGVDAHHHHHHHHQKGRKNNHKSIKNINNYIVLLPLSDLKSLKPCT